MLVLEQIRGTCHWYSGGLVGVPLKLENGPEPPPSLPEPPRASPSLPGRHGRGGDSRCVCHEPIPRNAYRDHSTHTLLNPCHTARASQQFAIRVSGETDVGQPPFPNRRAGLASLDRVSALIEPSFPSAPVPVGFGRDLVDSRLLSLK